ncbi:MAG: lipoate--protein ligase family protein [Planctomycetes bacterium]|nr:lipoate--protein ligase family protein [Planctomycetota bacterium]
MRLILDLPADGAWNMAVDEVLLADAAEQGNATLRFYQWREPTLSLGYFQGHAEREAHAASRGCPLVRRASGGGAIVHDAELTYSLAMPAAGSKFAAADLYILMHETLVQTLARLGIKAWRHSQTAQSVTAPEPFLCFQRRAEGDVISDDFKIAGSAQRRRGPAVLQHGSVLLQSSAAAPELPGLADLSGRAVSPEELAQPWLDSLLKRGLGPWVLSPLESWMYEGAAALVREKYASDMWNQRR